MRSTEALQLLTGSPNISSKIYFSILLIFTTAPILSSTTKLGGSFGYRNENTSLKRGLKSVSLSLENVSHIYSFLTPTPIKRTVLPLLPFIKYNVGSDSFQKRKHFSLKQNASVSKHNLEILRKGIKPKKSIRMLVYKRSKLTTQRYIKKRKNLTNVKKKGYYKPRHRPTTYSDNNTQQKWIVNNVSISYYKVRQKFKYKSQSKLYRSTPKTIMKYTDRSKNGKRVGAFVSRSTSKDKHFSLKNTNQATAKPVKKSKSALMRSTTPNNTWVRLWKSQIVWVSLLKDNETLKPNNRDMYDEAMENTKRKKYALSLTPPIVVAWVYKLARALSEGNL